MSTQTMPPTTQTSFKIVPKIAPKVPKIVPKITLKPAPVPITAPEIKLKSINETKTKQKAPTMGASTDDTESVDDSSLSSTASESSTYITPVYGVDMRVSLDNKYIYDIDFNLVGTVLDDKSIEWIDEE